ncbi:MAG: glutamate--cysteine ligase, partial [Rhizobium rosettiformans]
EMTAGWTVEDVVAMRDAVPAQGLKASVAGRPLMEVAREVVEISRTGLKARAQLNAEGQDESVFLNTLDEVLAKRTTLADDMLALYHGRWNGSVDPVFVDYQY